MPTGLQVLNRQWLGLIVLHISLLIHLLLYMLDPTQGNSGSFRLLAAVVTAFALGAVAVSLCLNEDRVRQIAPRLARWWIVYIGMSLGIMSVFGLAMRPEWVYAHIAVALAGTFALVYRTVYSDRMVSLQSRWLVAGGGVLVIVITAIRLYGLSYYPFLHADEPWTLSWAVNQIETGQISDRMMHGFNGDPRYDIPRYYMLLAWWLHITGVGLWEARAFNLAMTFVVIVLTWRAAHNLYGPLAGFFTAGALFASTILIAGVRIRHDIGLAVAIAASLWLFSVATRRDQLRWHLFAGAAMGWGMFAHYYATFLGVALLAGLYGPRYIQNLRNGRYWPEPGAWWYVVGALLAASSVLAVQVLPDIQAFLGNRQPRTGQSLQSLADGLSFYLRSIFTYSRLEFILIALGVAAAFWRRRIIDWSMGITVILGHVFLGVFATAVPDPYYIIPLTPLYGILIGSLFGRGFSRLPESGSKTRPVRVVVFALFLVANLALSLAIPLRVLMNRQPLRLPPMPAAQWVREHVEPGSTILGAHIYYLWLTDYDYVSPYIPYRILPSMREKFPTNADIWDSLGIDIVIDDPTLAANDVVAAVRDSGYLQSRGYVVIDEIPAGDKTIRIYGRTAPG